MTARKIPLSEYREPDSETAKDFGSFAALRPERVAAIIIDPPVGPYSSPDDIRAWLKELARMRAELAGNCEPSVMESVDRCISDATAYLENAIARE